jgi:transcriptional regulator with XRE-family HTH domain
MKAAGLSQKTLAQKAGLSETYIRDIFAGRSLSPRIDKLQAVADIFGCRVDELSEARVKPGDTLAESDHQAQIDIPSNGKIKDDPSQLHLLYIWDQLRPEMRVLAFRILQNLIDVSTPKVG